MSEGSTESTDLVSDDHPDLARSSSNQIVLDTEPSSQLRTTLAVGELLASRRPTAGNRLIAYEINKLTNVLKNEFGGVRKEIDNLSTNLATTLKNVLEEDREQRNISAQGPIRRLGFGHLPNRRFPVFRRPRRVPLQFARKSTKNAYTNTPFQNFPTDSSNKSISTGLEPRQSHSPIGNKNLVAPKQIDETNSNIPLKVIKSAPSNKTVSIDQSVAKSPTPSAFTSSMNSLGRLFKAPWYFSSMVGNSSTYEGEADSENSDSSPSSSP